MVWETPADPAAERADSAPGGGGEEGESGASPEHVGPVAIERLRKDDGRALILYSRIDKQQ